MKNLICAFFLLSGVILGWCSDQPEEAAQLVVFFSPSCHTCQKAKQEFIPRVSAALPGRFQVQFRDLSDMETYSYLLNLEEKHSVKLANITPIFYMNGRFLNGRGLDARVLEHFVRTSLDAEYVPAGSGQVDLVKRFLKFTPLLIISAGFIDGVNPCAFTVIVFFVSFLALQGYRKRELIVIGSLFITGVFVTYLLLGIGVFGFLYAMRGFWQIIRIVNVTIGFISIILGCLALVDAVRFYRSGGKTENLLLQLPESVKKQIHAVIGIAYRHNTRTNIGNPKAGIIRLGATAIVTGFLVSLLEAVCTGQTYIPTIAFVFKTTQLQFQAFMLLVLYNIVFVLPLVFIFVLALMGTTSQQFAGFIRRRMILIKIIMAVFFFGMGVFLVGRL